MGSHQLLDLVAHCPSGTNSHYENIAFIYWWRVVGKGRDGEGGREEIMYMYIMSLFYRWARSQYESSFTIRTAHCSTQHWLQERWWHLESCFERYKIYSILVFPFNPSSSSSSSLSKPLTCAFCWEECPDSGCIGCCTAAPQSKTTPNTHTRIISQRILCLSSLSPHPFSSSLTLSFQGDSE